MMKRDAIYDEFDVLLMINATARRKTIIHEMADSTTGRSALNLRIGKRHHRDSI